MNLTKEEAQARRFNKEKEEEMEIDKWKRTDFMLLIVSLFYKYILISKSVNLSKFQPEFSKMK